MVSWVRYLDLQGQVPWGLTITFPPHLLGIGALVVTYPPTFAERWVLSAHFYVWSLCVSWTARGTGLLQFTINLRVVIEHCVVCRRECTYPKNVGLIVSQDFVWEALEQPVGNRTTYIILQCTDLISIVSTKICWQRNSKLRGTVRTRVLNSDSHGLLSKTRNWFWGFSCERRSLTAVHV